MSRAALGDLDQPMKFIEADRPAVVSPIVLVAAGAVFAAVREDVQTLCVAIAVIAVLAGSAFAGPIGVWLYAGVGGCVVVLALAAIQFRQRRQ